MMGNMHILLRLFWVEACFGYVPSLLLCLVGGSFGFMIVFTNGPDHFVMRNSSVQLTISNGRITSLLDTQFGLDYSCCVRHTSEICFLSKRELIQGAAGGLVIYEDRPLYWDAWGGYFKFVRDVFS
jgi:hypothetical protein